PFGFTKLGVWATAFPAAPMVVSARSVPVWTVKNWADLIDRRGATCQLLARTRSTELEENLGVFATRLNPNRCRTSMPLQLLRHARRLSGRDTPVAVGLSL